MRIWIKSNCFFCPKCGITEETQEHLRDLPPLPAGSVWVEATPIFGEVPPEELSRDDPRVFITHTNEGLRIWCPQHGMIAPSVDAEGRLAFEFLSQ